MSARDRRIVGISGGCAAIKRLAIRRVEGAAATETNRQIGIGQKKNCEGHQIGPTSLDRGVGAREIVTFVGHQGATPQFAEKTDVGRFAIADRIARGRLDDVQIRQSKTVKFVLTPYMFSLINRDWKRVVEPGEFKLMVGASSADIRKDVTINVVAK